MSFSQFPQPQKLLTPPCDGRCSFVVSSPRSGSTWLQRLLSCLPDTVCIESRPYGQFFEMWPETSGTSTPRITVDEFVQLMSRHINLKGMDGVSPDAWVTSCTRLMLHAIHESVRESSGKSVVVEKVTPYLGTSDLVLERIAKDFPESTVVQLVRDGRDVVTSGFFHWINRNARGTERYRFFVQNKGRCLTRFFDDGELAKWCRYWCEPIKAFQRRDEDYTVVKYEQMKSEASVVLMQLSRLFAIEVSKKEVGEACENASFSKMSGGRGEGKADHLGHVRKGVVGDWRNYFTKRDGEIFLEETDDILVHSGYETDQDWIRDLPDTLEETVTRPTRPFWGNFPFLRPK